MKNQDKMLRMFQYMNLSLLLVIWAVVRVGLS
jgi:hypothetical protein